MDRLPGAVKLAADSMGVTAAELMKMMEQGELMAEDFLPKFAVAMRESVREGDALNKMMQGTSATLGRFINSVNDATLSFNRGGFGKSINDFFRQFSDTLNSLDKSGFFEGLGFAFRMLMLPVRAFLELLESLGKIFSDTSERGEQIKSVLTTIALILGVLLLPALLSIGKAIAPVLLTVVGLLALSDIMAGLAGDSSEFATNWENLTNKLKEGKATWEDWAKVLGQGATALAGVVGAALLLRKLNPFKSKGGGTVSAPSTGAGGAGAGATGASWLSRILGVSTSALYSSKLGDATLQGGETPFPSNARQGASNPDLPMFNDNTQMINNGGRAKIPYSAGLLPQTPAVNIGDVYINGLLDNHSQQDVQNAAADAFIKMFNGEVENTIRDFAR